MIKAIIEKYTDSEMLAGYGNGFLSNGIHPNKFPALTAELETLMREEACRFSEWTSRHFFSLVGGRWYTVDYPNGLTTDELYEQFKNTI